jgi:hypothetical protein
MQMLILSSNKIHRPDKDRLERRYSACLWALSSKLLSADSYYIEYFL